MLFGRKGIGVPEPCSHIWKMAGTPTPLTRSALMARIRGKDTKPELIVRRLLHKHGYRFRTHYKPVPGSPDVAFTARRKAVLVHGCFWHGHEGCRRANMPATRTDFWRAKFDRNRARDQRQEQEAAALGWETIVVWECEVKNQPALLDRLVTFIGPTRLSRRP